MSTIQLDFAAKSRFGLSYIDDAGAKNNEVFVIHRSPLSTHERFMAFLIEHYGGVWPVWLSPVQVQLLPVSAKHVESALTVADELKSIGLRVDVDEADETVGNKVRKAVSRKTPYIVVLGDRELSGGEWTVRVRGEKDQVTFSRDSFITKVKTEVLRRELK